MSDTKRNLVDILQPLTNFESILEHGFFVLLGSDESSLVHSRRTEYIVHSTQQEGDRLLGAAWCGRLAT